MKDSESRVCPSSSLCADAPYTPINTHHSPEYENTGVERRVRGTDAAPLVSVLSRVVPSQLHVGGEVEMFSDI